LGQASADDDDVHRPRAEDLERDADVAASRVLDLRDLHSAILIAGRALDNYAAVSAATATSASVTSTMPSRSATAMCSSGVWISIIPFARFTHCSPRALKTFASAPPPLSTYDGVYPARWRA